MSNCYCLPGRAGGSPVVLVSEPAAIHAFDLAQRLGESFDKVANI